MRAIILLSIILCFSVLFNVESHRTVFAIDEHWVCNTKKTCLECLRQSHCSWCSNENKCFSSKLQWDGFCQNYTVVYKDYGFSIEDNAACECFADNLERVPLCRPGGALAAEPECSGRGTCQCGRCLCPEPDTQHPTKMVMGEYCEFDNYSCDGQDCGEGPYSLVPPKTEEAAAAADAASAAAAAAAAADDDTGGEPASDPQFADVTDTIS